MSSCCNGLADDQETERLTPWIGLIGIMTDKAGIWEAAKARMKEELRRGAKNNTDVPNCKLNS